MAIVRGTVIGPYTVDSLIGAGGMGEVYRATDRRLGRVVAIKILPSHAAGDSEFQQRLEREARVISHLSDPHVCALFDIGRENGIAYLVMEYLEGETLSARISRGPLPIDQVLIFGEQIAHALDSAHRNGIIHRDLKPGNIMITRSGIKLLDFGLAKQQSVESAESTGSNLETAEASIYRDGYLVGTVPYMAPEQLEGKPVDARADIFALGAVLYEMVTGQRAFRGDSRAALISAIFNTPPPAASATRSHSHPALDWVIQKCLARDKEERWQNAGDLAAVLRGFREAPFAAQPAEQRPAAGRALLRWIVPLLLALLIAGALLYGARRGREFPVMQVSVVPPEKTIVTSLALSPDGRELAFVAVNQAGVPTLWIHSLENGYSHNIPGTEDASYPFWSPDSRSVGFFAKGQVMTTDLSGEDLQVLTTAPDGRGGSWGTQGTILFSRPFTGIFGIKSTGGQVQQIVFPDPSRHEFSFRWPCFLPDGRHFLFNKGAAAPRDTGVFVGSLDSRQFTRLLPDDAAVQYSSAGYMLLLRNGVFTAQPFDAKKLRLTGDPFPLAERVQAEGGTVYSGFSISTTGMLAYNSWEMDSELVLFDRTGHKLQELKPAGLYAAPVFSPDGKSVVVARADPATRLYSLYKIDTSSGAITRLTFARDYITVPAVWSPDGKWIAYSANQGGSVDIHLKDASGAGSDHMLIHSKETKVIDDWSQDGRYLLYEKIDPVTRSDLWVMPMFGSQKPMAYIQTPSIEKYGQFAPNGKYVAYSSDETGRKEIYVQSFPDSGAGRWQVSSDGGDQPRWSKDGSQLFYLAATRDLMSVDIKWTPAFQAGVPHSLISTQLPPVPLAGGFLQYAVNADRQFVINTLMENARSSSINLVLNWDQLLKRGQ